jgi:hypothetical protein
VTSARSPVQWALPAAAVAAYLLAALVWVGNDRRSAREVFPAGSVWNTGDDGLSLAFAYLSARAAGRPGIPRVAVLTRRLESTSLPPRAVLLRVEPDAGDLAAITRRLAGGDGGEDDDGEDSGDHGGSGKNGKSGKATRSGPQPRPVPEPAARTEPLLTAAEEEWVRGGGRLVLAVGSDFGSVEVGRPAGAGAARKAFPIWPGVRRLLPDPTRTLAGPPLSGMHALWLEGDAPIVARLALGAGDLVLLACPEVLHNRLLGRGDHLTLLEALAGRGSSDTGGTGTGGGGTGGMAGAGGRPVYFDERGHGAAQSAGMLEILASWGLGPLLLLLAAAGGAAWWRAAVRVGPPDRDDRDVRSDAVELLDSLGDLYDRALGRGDALRLYHDSFVRTVAADTGLGEAALAARTAELAPGLSLAELPPSREPLAAGARLPATSQPAPDLPRPAFDRLLDTLNQAFRRLDDAKRR